MNISKLEKDLVKASRKMPNIESLINQLEYAVQQLKEANNIRNESYQRMSEVLSNKEIITVSATEIKVLMNK